MHFRHRTLLVFSVLPSDYIALTLRSTGVGIYCTLYSRFWRKLGFAVVSGWSRCLSPEMRNSVGFSSLLKVLQ